ncbi:MULTISPECIES: nucleoid-associated protein [Kandleria]|jgi:hypothetical protein|uniref:Nucleoid-associated protein n=1 Tax=Kandleria vitulina DSM 20405 TaxID=1410657 RepID=A0A0R2HBA8_9FIRM|nr:MULTISPECIES: nucleoid-associated protein [Kandleria]KRN50288.1 hypothetical protein IV49_GL000298 [Kandleria vitulina DSM 20405]MBP3276039.1 nucleoid-associated protein [Kandleria sp.]MEE0987769.1 nucleoid-associated protein [Kandleria vitulina]SDL20289.1 hypothetical protein SAMN05216520_10266 [Kandleria vitulina]SEI61644.1 hypothetical protein SAMN05216514_101285 [Kandleria vitulina]
MQNTIIINKVLMHMLDFEHNTIHLSEEFAPINDTTRDYYHKKIEKALYSNQLKELTVPSLHEMILRGDKMVESDEEFLHQAKEITEHFFKLGTMIQAMPNANMLYVDCYQDGEHVIACLKLNYKYVPMTVIEEGNVRLTRRQIMPTQGSPVDEAIVINVDKKTISLIEKKYSIDGKLQTYLNKEWIKGEEKLTDRQKFNTMKKVVNKLDDIYHVNKTEGLPVMKRIMNEKLMNDEVIKPIEIVKKVLEKDYQASEEADVMMKDLGVGEDDVMKSMPSGKSLETCKLTTDTEVEVKMNVEDYVSGTNYEKVKNEDGTITLMLKNINELVIK